jgi:hypothetical protein
MDTGDAHHLAISYLIPKGWKATDTYLLTDDPGYSATGDWHELKKVN